MYALQQGAAGIEDIKLIMNGYKYIYRRYAPLEVFEGTMQGIT
jgi:hypothetical protein